MLIVVAMENVIVAGQRSIVGQKDGLVVNVKNGIAMIVDEAIILAKNVDLNQSLNQKRNLTRKKNQLQKNQ
jgi:methyl coenzyme M reductase gamma subunit